MSDLIVLGVILLALNRLDKIDGESYERNRVSETIVEQSANPCHCVRGCQDIHESVNIVCQARIADGGKYAEHKATVQAPSEKP